MNYNFIEISEDEIINSSYIIAILKQQKMDTHYRVIEGEFDFYIIVKNYGNIIITKEKYIEIKNFLLNEKK